MVEEHGVGRVEADRLVVVADGAVVLPLGRPLAAAGVVEPRRAHRVGVGVDADRFAVIVNRLVVLAPGSPDPAAGVVGAGALGVELDRPGESARALSSSLVKDHAVPRTSHAHALCSSARMTSVK